MRATRDGSRRSPPAGARGGEGDMSATRRWLLGTAAGAAAALAGCTGVLPDDEQGAEDDEPGDDDEETPNDDPMDEIEDVVDEFVAAVHDQDMDRILELSVRDGPYHELVEELAESDEGETLFIGEYGGVVDVETDPDASALGADPSNLEMFLEEDVEEAIDERRWAVAEVEMEAPEDRFLLVEADDDWEVFWVYEFVELS